MTEEDYHSIKSYIIEEEQVKIRKHDINISLLCMEGNIVWVTRGSKVGSGGVDSCMFVIIILNDGSKICLHHNVVDGDVPFRTIPGLLNPSDISILPSIFQSMNGENMVGEQINEIYLCAQTIYDFDGYQNLIDYYSGLTDNLYLLYGFRRYLVDDNNVVYALI